MRPAANSLLFTATKLSPAPTLQPPTHVHNAPRSQLPAVHSHQAVPRAHSAAAHARAQSVLQPPQYNIAPTDVQMRPAANSLLFTATKLSPAPTLQPPTHVHNVLAPATFASAPLVKEPAITMAIKPQPDPKQKPKKDKGMNKEEAIALVKEATEELARSASSGGAETLEAGSDSAPVRRLQDLQLPDKLLRRANTAAFEHAIQSEAEEAVAAALPGAACVVVRAIKRAPVVDTLRSLVGAHHPHARLPALLAHALHQRLLTLAEVGSWCEGGAFHPLLLQLLQELKLLLGPDKLHQLYTDSKINLCAYVSGKEGAECMDAGGILDALEARGLAGLVPQLRVQAQLARQLQQEPQPHHLYRWIKANVEPSVRQNAAFVSELVALVARHVTMAAGSADKSADKQALDKEKALVETYAPLLTALLEGRADLQLHAVYAVQLHAHHHRYPKGMLLRWFMYLYNLEVCEEDAFLRWREDVTDAYPGKGEALFQVNTWLTWLQQQESEDEEAED
ncbi:hypothetical protein O0L34_g8679 [Tuta absoluta]|nr:hypothetical protein O0L34_g8679 [Tuta absoluta]